MSLKLLGSMFGGRSAEVKGYTENEFVGIGLDHVDVAAEPTFVATQDNEVLKFNITNILDSQLKEDLCENAFNQETRTIPEHTRTYEHFQQYPIAHSWIKIVNWFPQLHIVRKSLVTIAYSKHFKPYTITSDSYIDERLDKLDESIPFIRVLTMRDIRNVILDNPSKAIAETSKNILGCLFKFNDNIAIRQTRNLVYSARKARDRFVSLNNKALLRSQLDPVMRRINQALFNVFNNNFLHQKQEELMISHSTFDPQSNEMSYTFRIVALMLDRSQPILRSKIVETSLLPRKFSHHVAMVYQSSKENRGDTNIVILIASLDTMRVLVNDSIKLAVDNPFVTLFKAKPHVEDITVSVEPLTIKV